mmetsp:Transcript_97644/g.304571  ORF Transcript_97644/g.304571 Transcript_97644/m.304571 type:complete len:437 (+) Transcript_97644:671-1981(+)
MPQALELGELLYLVALLQLAIQHGLPLSSLHHPDLVELLLLEDLQLALALLLGSLEGIQSVAAHHRVLAILHPLCVRNVALVVDLAHARQGRRQRVVLHRGLPALARHPLVGVVVGGHLEGLDEAVRGGRGRDIRRILLFLGLQPSTQPPGIDVDGQRLVLFVRREEVNQGVQGGAAFSGVQGWGAAAEGGGAGRAGVVEVEGSGVPEHVQLLQRQGVEEGSSAWGRGRLRRLADGSGEAQGPLGGVAQVGHGPAAGAVARLAEAARLLLLPLQPLAPPDLPEDGRDLHPELALAMAGQLQLRLLRPPAHALRALLEGPSSCRVQPPGPRESVPGLVLAAAAGPGPRAGLPADAGGGAGPARPGRPTLQRQRAPHGPLLGRAALLDRQCLGELLLCLCPCLDGLLAVLIQRRAQVLQERRLPRRLPLLHRPGRGRP